jgi:hypothetical protein
MAEALIERELRRILRDRKRERQMQEEKEERERKRLEELERIEHRTIQRQFDADYFELDLENINQQESDKESELSDLNTIDEFLHATTLHDIQDLENNEPQNLVQPKDQNRSLESNFAFLDDHIEMLDKALDDIRDQRDYTNKGYVRTDSILDRHEI